MLPKIHSRKVVQTARWTILACFAILAACDGDNVDAGQERLLSVTVDGRRRTFIFYIPDRYDEGRDFPLLFAFHGTPGNGPGMRRSTGLDEIADRKGWLIAYPNGIDGSWGAGCLCSDSDLAGVDDVEFVRRMIARIRSEYSVDPRRIYAVGFSSGGFMSYRVACDLADTFAASASVASSMTWIQAQTCTPISPTPVFTMIGTDDASFPVQGTGSSDGDRMPIDSTFSFWGRIDGCGPEPLVDYSPAKDNGLDVRKEVYPGCAGRSEVSRYVIEGGMHAWPATANVVLQAFFERHSLPQ